VVSGALVLSKLPGLKKVWKTLPELTLTIPPVAFISEFKAAI
jgi:hypothetical protein